MENKVFILEVLLGCECEVFILRDGKGKIVKSTTDKDEFIDYLRNGEIDDENNNNENNNGENTDD